MLLLDLIHFLCIDQREAHFSRLSAPQRQSQRSAELTRQEEYRIHRGDEAICCQRFEKDSIAAEILGPAHQRL